MKIDGGKTIDSIDWNQNGGRGGIRTHGSLATTSDFESDALDHSATLPTADFIRHLCVFAFYYFLFAACIHANDHTLLKDLAKVVGSEIIQLRPDARILRQIPHQGQG